MKGSDGMNFDYFYGSEADQFSFFRIPKRLILSADFATLSLPAKLLYSLLLDRMALSAKNGWLDDKNRVFIIYQVGEIQEDLGVTKKKAIDLLAELEDFGLLEKKRRGHGLPNILYIKSFLMDKNRSRSTNSSTSGTKMKLSRSVRNGTSDATGSDSVHDDNLVSYVDCKEGMQEKCRNSGYNYHTSVNSAKAEVSGIALHEVSGTILHEVQKTAPLEVPELAPLEVQESAPLSINTYKNHTNINNTESNPIASPDRSDQDDDGDIKTKREMIKENIGYRYLLKNHTSEAKTIDGILDLIVETVLSKNEYTVIASSRIPTSVVRSRFMKLNMSHIEYVLNCLDINSTKVRNIKKYLLAALFNAPATMDAYYRAEVNHDTMAFASKMDAEQFSL